MTPYPHHVGPNEPESANALGDQSQNHRLGSFSHPKGSGEFFNPQAFWSQFQLGLRALESRVLKLKWPLGLLREVLDRVVLALNHVLLQEPQALERLKRQRGRTLSVQWHDWVWSMCITPAGLLENTGLFQPNELGRESDRVSARKIDLSITLTEPSLIDVANRLMQDEKPSIRIEGDIQLAAEVNWLVDHVKWDYEDDLSKILGDANAHQLVRIAHWVFDGLKRFVARAHERANALGKGVSKP
jgi:ubiquinone biosynthesis accessory factor UbiJ